MFLKRLGSLLTGLVLAVALTTAAFAQGAVGIGTVQADGDGVARLAGNGTATVSGAGVLYIRDRAGDANITIEGTGTRRAGATWVRYVGFEGSATVTGSDVVVMLSGVNVSLAADGSGSVYLRGSGTYTIAGQSGEWLQTGQRYDIK